MHFLQTGQIKEYFKMTLFSYFHQVYFGTSNGQIIVMDVHGAMVSQVTIAHQIPVLNMAWSCEKFKMEEGDDSKGTGIFKILHELVSSPIFNIILI